MKKLILLTISIIVIILLSTTITSAVESNLIKNNQENENNEKLYERYIDPDILLTKKDLSILKQAVKYIYDEKYKLVVEKLIIMIEKNGKAQSKDIQEILNNSNSTFYMRFGAIFGNGGGRALGIPGFIRMFNGLWINKGGALCWKSSRQITIGQYSYSKSSGIAIGFFGIVYNGWKWIQFSNQPWYTFIGLAPLIIVEVES